VASGEVYDEMRKVYLQDDVVRMKRVNKDMESSCGEIPKVVRTKVGADLNHLSFVKLDTERVKEPRICKYK